MLKKYDKKVAMIGIGIIGIMALFFLHHCLCMRVYDLEHNLNIVKVFRFYFMANGQL